MDKKSKMQAEKVTTAQHRLCTGISEGNQHPGVVFIAR